MIVKAPIEGLTSQPNAMSVEVSASEGDKIMLGGSGKERVVAVGLDSLLNRIKYGKGIDRV